VPGSKSDYTEGNLMKAIFNAVTFPAPAGLWVSLHNGLTSQANRDANLAAHTNTEIQTTGTGYARTALSATSANWPITGAAPTTAHNGAVVTFPTPTAGWGTIFAFGIYDANTGGNLLYWGDMVGATQVGYCNANASAGVISAAAHGLAVGNQVRVWAASNMLPGLGLPTGLTDEQIYYVGTVPTVDTFTLSTTAGNANPVPTTTSGTVMFAQDQSQIVNTGNTVQFAVNGITVTED
jgi:hypothetical protein